MQGMMQATDATVRADAYERSTFLLMSNQEAHPHKNGEARLTVMRARGNTMAPSFQSLLSGLRCCREPRGRALEVVERLCRGISQMPRRGNRGQLPTDAEIAEQLGISVATVRSHLNAVAFWIEGLEELPPRIRIYLWFRQRERERAEHVIRRREAGLDIRTSE